MHETPRLKLPYIVAGQAQKEIAHNEALAILDALCLPTATEGPLDTPPPSPEIGTSYIVGSAPSGAWTGRASNIAIYSDGGWRFVVPPIGTRMVVSATGLIAEMLPSGWSYGVIHAEEVRIGGQKVVSTQRPAIADPSGGTGTDDAARTAISEILSAMRHHGLIAN